jgi:Holliday junction resolvase RusA-like endonuclease
MEIFSGRHGNVIRLALLGRPRGKQAMSSTRDSAHHYLPEQTRDYMGALRYVAEQVMGDLPPLDGPLWVDILIHLPIPQSWPKKRQEAARSGALRPTVKPDCDNFSKICDALNLVVWVDDRQIVDNRQRKFYSDKPGLFVEVRQNPAEGIFA